VAAAGASASAPAIGQPVTFIGQPSFAFQPIGKVCCDFANITDKRSSSLLAILMRKMAVSFCCLFLFYIASVMCILYLVVFMLLCHLLFSIAAMELISSCGV